jgi:hypothetical protein
MDEETAETEDTEDKPPYRHNLLRIGRLTTLREISIECGRLYRRAAKGMISSADASRQASILSVMRTCLESSNTEAKLSELEEALVKLQTTATPSVVPFSRRA